MRNKIVAIIVLLLGLSLLCIGIIQRQFILLNSLYNEMVLVP